MCVVSHSQHGLGRDGGCWQRIFRAQPGFGLAAWRKMPERFTVCVFGTVLAHDWTGVESNLCMAE